MFPHFLAVLMVLNNDISKDVSDTQTFVRAVVS